MKQHEAIYVNEDRRQAPKECFKFLAEHSAHYLGGLTNPAILDVGCATGDFLYYLSTLYPQAELTGLDFNQQFIDLAACKFSKAKYLKGDVDCGLGLPLAKYDAVFMDGVNYIFEDHRRYLDNLISLTRPGGRVYVFGIFNPEPVDVWAKVKRCGESDYEPGWNIISQRSIGDHLRQKNVDYRFVEWNIGLDIPKNDRDPLRAWTERLAGGDRLEVNGAQLVHRFYLLELTVRSENERAN